LRVPIAVSVCGAEFEDARRTRRFLLELSCCGAACRSTFGRDKAGEWKNISGELKRATQRPGVRMAVHGNSHVLRARKTWNCSRSAAGLREGDRFSVAGSKRLQRRLRHPDMVAEYAPTRALAWTAAYSNDLSDFSPSFPQPLPKRRTTQVVDMSYLFNRIDGASRMLRNRRPRNRAALRRSKIDCR